MLIAKNLIKKFGDRAVLDNVSLEIKPGTITSIIGPSGAGKTTLLRTLAMLEFADEGEISIDNTSYRFPTNSIAGREPWPEITIVFQQLFIWPHLTLKQNILLPLGEVISDKQEKELADLVTRFQMDHFIDRYPNEVSLGQRQRAALVRALMLHPKYLLLDEITSSLDVEQVNIILSHLTAVRDSGVGILIVTHLINFAEQVSDQIIFLDSGQILETGKEVIKNPNHPRVKKFLSILKAAS